MPGFGEAPQGPANFFFPKGEMGVFGVHQLRVIGSGIFGTRTPAAMAFQSGASTGLVPATGVGSGGVPGVSATFTATGIYQLRFPPTKSVDISAQVYSSSGYIYAAAINNLSGPSGSAQLEITRLPAGGAGSLGQASGVGYNPIQASGFNGYIPTGSTVALSFFAAPVADGITSF